MADSNALALLPPRHTAQAPQAPQASSANQPSKTTGDESFNRKLEKAKSKSVPVVKKQVVEVPVKTAAVKASDAKPTVKAVADQPVVADTTIAIQPKTNVTQAEHPTTTEQQQPATPDAKPLPALEEQAIATSVPSEKKPVKIAKAVAAKADQPAVNLKLAVPANPQQVVHKSQDSASKTQQDPTAATDAKPSDAKAVVTAISDQNSANDTPADGTPAGDGEFGTGKIIAGSVSGRKNPASPAAQDRSAPDPSTAANTAVLLDAAALDASPAIDVVLEKTVARPEAQIGGISTDLSGVAAPLSSGGSPAIAGKIAAATVTPQARFIEENHPQIVSSIQGQLMPHGGTLQIRLDPPELGALQVTVHLRDGVMTASFETSNDEATKLLSHSLGQLKSGLEAAGVSVDKIHVEQAPKRDSQGDSNDSKQPPQEQQRQAQQDQQRREMVQRMWRKLAGGGDPLDLVA